MDEEQKTITKLQLNILLIVFISFLISNILMFLEHPYFLHFGVIGMFGLVFFLIDTTLNNDIKTKRQKDNKQLNNNKYK